MRYLVDGETMEEKSPKESPKEGCVDFIKRLW